MGDGNRTAKQHADFVHRLLADDVPAVDEIPGHVINEDPYSEELVVMGRSAVDSDAYAK